MRHISYISGSIGSQFHDDRGREFRVLRSGWKNLVDDTFEAITGVRAQSVTALVEEKNAHAALELCDRAYVLESGAVASVTDPKYRILL